MKKKDLKELRNKDVAELQAQVAQRRKKLLEFTPSLYAGRENNVKVGWKLRREIAQILSILTQRESKNEN